MHPSRFKKKSKLVQKLIYCVWFAVFLSFAGISVYLVAKYVPSDRIKVTSDAVIKTAEHGREIVMAELEPLLQHVRKPAKTSAPQLPSTPVSLVVSSMPTLPTLNVNTPPSRQLEFNEIHFIHIPKCGGTTMTAVLRQLMCNVDEVKNKDCCTNPGFCDWHAFRRCASIKGCINHFPNRKLIFNAMPSIAVFREPTSRLISAYYYRGHSPNLDFFQVRPEFKEISQGKRPHVLFPHYIEMVEYQNIFTRMLGADSFPYRNITITEDVYNKALEAVNRLDFVALQEEFDVSIEVIKRAMHLNHLNVTVTKERNNEGKRVKEEKMLIKTNKELMDKVRSTNSYDVQLYQQVIKKFCQQLQDYPDLMQVVKQHGLVHC
ncbi:hypothetical protein EON65_28440 [archaeon]|nr:MAG: hypothetical protein EON65_28440 [archaeon]